MDYNDGTGYGPARIITRYAWLIVGYVAVALFALVVFILMTRPGFLQPGDQSCDVFLSLQDTYAAFLTESDRLAGKSGPETGADFGRYFARLEIAAPEDVINSAKRLMSVIETTGPTAGADYEFARTDFLRSVRISHTCLESLR